MSKGTKGRMKEQKSGFIERSDVSLGCKWIKVIINMPCLCQCVCVQMQRHGQIHGKDSMIQICMYAWIRACVCVCQNVSPPPEASLHAFLQPFCHTDLISTTACGEGAETATQISSRATQSERLRDAEATLTIPS